MSAESEKPGFFKIVTQVLFNAWQGFLKFFDPDRPTDRVSVDVNPTQVSMGLPFSTVSGSTEGLLKPTGLEHLPTPAPSQINLPVDWDAGGRVHEPIYNFVAIAQRIQLRIDDSIVLNFGESYDNCRFEVKGSGWDTVWHRFTLIWGSKLKLKLTPYQNNICELAVRDKESRFKIDVLYSIAGPGDCFLPNVKAGDSGWIRV